MLTETKIAEYLEHPPDEWYESSGQDAKDRIKAHADPIAPVKTMYPAPAVEALYDDSYDDDEPTSEELIEMLREALREADEGKTYPIEDLFREMDEMLAEDANHR